MKEIQKHKKILLIVSVFIVLSLLICVWWLGRNDVKESENKVSADEILIEQEKEAEGGLKDEKPEETENIESEEVTPFIYSAGNSMNDKDADPDQKDSEQKDSDQSNVNDKHVENDESTDNTENDADVGLEQDATEQTTGKYGNFF